jgi:bacillithiol system protein YtxJ
MSSPDFIAIKTDEDWQDVKAQASQQNKQLLLAKLSPACPISHMAERELRDWHASHSIENVIFVEVDVIRSRNLARGIAKEVGVEHQSPQLICFDSQMNPIWHESHQSISSPLLDSKLS